MGLVSFLHLPVSVTASYEEGNAVGLFKGKFLILES
jgi:hypothetical protein